MPIPVSHHLRTIAKPETWDMSWAYKSIPDKWNKLFGPSRSQKSEGHTKEMATLHLAAPADAMHEEPSGFHAAIEGPLNLAGRNALFAAADELDRLQPQMQREMAVLENRADPHGEGLAAGIALAETGAAGLAGQATNPLVLAVSAMRANRAVRPQVSLDIGESSFLVVKMWGGQNRMGHRKSPVALTLYLAFGVVKCNVAKEITKMDFDDRTNEEKGRKS